MRAKDGGYKVPDKEIRDFARRVWKHSKQRGSYRPLYRALKRSGEPRITARRGR